MLARQLLTSKITMRADLDKLEDLKESLEKVTYRFTRRVHIEVE
jgi:hypothetical protein